MLVVVKEVKVSCCTVEGYTASMFSSLAVSLVISMQGKSRNLVNVRLEDVATSWKQLYLLT